MISACLQPGHEITVTRGGNQCPTCMACCPVLIMSQGSICAHRGDRRLLSQVAFQCCQAARPASQSAANSIPASPLKMHYFSSIMSSPGWVFYWLPTNHWKDKLLVWFISKCFVEICVLQETSMLIHTRSRKTWIEKQLKLPPFPSSSAGLIIESNSPPKACKFSPGTSRARQGILEAG